MTDDPVTLEVRSLLARYGLRPVLGALAKVRRQPPQVAELRPRETAKAGSEEKTGKTPGKLLARLQAQSPEQASLIRELVGLYDEKRFLPNLRMAEDFLAQHTGQRRKFKSRRAALPAVLGVIATIPREDLPRVRDEWTFASGRDGYNQLARAIMGTK
jgi:hypothetical protein